MKIKIGLILLGICFCFANRGANFIAGSSFSTVSKGQFIPGSYEDATKVIFSNGISFDTKFLGKSGEPEIPAELKVDYQDNENGYYIVQFSGPIYETQKKWLLSQGASIHFYIPNYGFVISARNRAMVEVIRANSGVNWVGIYQPAYKISALFNQVGDEHKVTMLLFIEADISSVLDKIKSITKRSEFSISDNGINKMIQGVVSKKDINALARVKEVLWIEPYFQPKLCNVDVQWIVQDCQPNVRNIWNKGIAGEGEIVNLVDTGIYTQHYSHCSGSPPITNFGYYPDHNAIVAYDSAGPYCTFYGTAHGTFVAGTMSGDDTLTPGFSPYDGVAKKARLYHNQIDTLFSLWFDLNELYIRPYNKYYPPIRAHISANPWGISAEGAYTKECLQVDQFMWTHKDFLILFPVGNSGPDPGTVGSPAAAKNLIAVGGSGNRTTGYTLYPSYNSRGPTDDGRLKPTVVSPSDPTTSSTAPPNGYSTFSGTTTAVAGAAGAAALARQYLREGWYPKGKKIVGNSWDYISAAMVKAILVNCADPNVSSYIVPDNNIGWGRIDLDSTLYFAGDERKLLLIDDTIGVLTGEYKDFHFNVPSGAANLKIAIVWTDYPGNPAVLKQIVNDLDLYAQVGATYYRGNQYSNGQSIPNASSRDTLNVEECVRVNAPDFGDWLARIEGWNVPYGPQPYALVITYSAPEIAGVVVTDKPVYLANDFIVDTVRIRVEDLNYGTVGICDTVQVVLTGKYIETQPETLLCIELAESSYVFKGEMPLLFRGATHNDGRLSVCQGDTIYVSYTDNNPSYISTTWAGVDAYYFVISNTHCENIEVTTVDVCWNTNEGANSKVYYGTDPSNLNLVASADTPYVLSHRLKLSELTQTTIYYYDVESRDFRGNTVRDNNGGLHYTFKTKAQTGVDVLVLLADGNTDATPSGEPLPQLRERFRKAVEQGGWNYHYWETSDYFGYTPNRDIMKDYKAVFMVYEDEYPPFLAVQQETVARYETLGARIAFGSHDVLWHAWQNSSNPGYDTLWCKNYMQVRFKYDGAVTGTYNIYGISGDPITGPYSAMPVSYVPHRSGAAYDSLESLNNPPNSWDTGVANRIWLWNSTTGGRIGSRWESNNVHGTIGDGVWGGYRTRTIFDGFSITQMDTIKLPDILNNHFIWLIGHDHPDVTLTSPVGDSIYTSSPITISWTATAYGGATIDTTWLEYSPDAGQTWYLIASGTGMTSPYSWDVSTMQNRTTYRVRVTVSDAGVYPSMKGFAETGNFRINIAGNDGLGPKVIPNSIIVANNPKFVTTSDTLLPFTAVVSDSETGISLISAAKYIAKHEFQSTGEKPMQVSDGVWDEVQEDVSELLRLVYVPGVIHICSLFVCGQDNAGNWGNWYFRTFTLINGQLSYMDVSELDTKIPFSYTLFPPLPNPAKRSVRITYAIPHSTQVNLRIYNPLGQLIRTLIDEEKKPGFYTITWDGADDLGRMLPAGVYFYQFTTEEFSDTKKTVLLK